MRGTRGRVGGDGEGAGEGREWGRKSGLGKGEVSIPSPVITEGTSVVRSRPSRAAREGVERAEAPPKRMTHRAVLEMEPSERRALLWQRIGWFSGVLVWLFVAIALAGYNPTDWPAPNVVPHNAPTMNPAGSMGALIAHFIYTLCGYSAWVALGLLAIVLVVTAAGRYVTHAAVRVVGGLLIVACVACAQALVMPKSGPVMEFSGGIVGTVGSDVLRDRFGPIIAGGVIALGIAIGATVALDVWAFLVAMWTGRLLYAGAKTGGRVALGMGQVVGGAVGEMASRMPQITVPGRVRVGDIMGRAGGGGGYGVRPDDVSDDEALVAEVPSRASSKGTRKGKVGPIDEQLGGLGGGGASESFDPEGNGSSMPAARMGSADDDDEDELEELEAASVSAPAAVVAQTPAAPKTFTPEELRAKIAKLPVRFSADSKRSATEADLKDIQQVQQNVEGYRFPGLDLLEEPEVNFSKTMETYVREQAEALERALKEYRIDGEVVGVESGPVITLYELRLAPGTKVAVLQAVASDLARSLKAINIRIVSNMAGRDTVGVEVPNAQKEKVRLKELMTKAEVYKGMKLPMFLGKDASGEPMIADLAAMPHMLIAGTTGSGKSVCMNSIIMSFLYTKKPNELKVVLVDPKMVELSQFKDIPHLMCPVVTEMGKATAILEWAVGKMDERYELLAEAGCRDISGYNELTWEELKDRLNPQTPEEEAKIPRKLPYMVFVIDELADLMMTNKEVEHSIVRIAQKARAVGMHLILATQRPQANVVTGLIKSNMPARVAFKVASGMDSRIVLDQKGGELLLGQGDMLYLSPRSSKLTRAQGTLVDDREIRRVVKFMREVATPTFERALMQIRSGKTLDGDEVGVGGEAKNGLLAAQEDDLFDQAVEVVVESKRGSVSMLQRRFGIGYTRAARLIEMMGEAGILGEHKGTVAREVVMTLEEWHALKAQALADAEAAERGEGLPSRPIAATLEQAQSIVNDGNLKEQLEESQAKATEDVDDADDDALDAVDDDDDGEDGDDEEDADDAGETDDSETDDSPSAAPFVVQTRVGKGPVPAPKRTS